MYQLLTSSQLSISIFSRVSVTNSTRQRQNDQKSSARGKDVVVQCMIIIQQKKNELTFSTYDITICY